MVAVRAGRCAAGTRGGAGRIPATLRPGERRGRAMVQAAGRRPGGRAMPGGGRGAGRPKPNFAVLGRAIRYTGRYRGLAVIAYGALLIATAAQLMVPQLVQNIIDTIQRGYT